MKKKKNIWVNPQVHKKKSTDTNKLKTGVLLNYLSCYSDNIELRNEWGEGIGVCVKGYRGDEQIYKVVKGKVFIQKKLTTLSKQTFFNYYILYEIL